MEGFEVKKRTAPHYQKDYIKTVLFCVFFGFFGVHRFYTSYKRIGFLQLCTVGGFLIWWIIDLIALSFNRYKDKYGNELDEYNPMVGSLILTGIALFLLAGFIMVAPKLMGIE